MKTLKISFIFIVLLSINFSCAKKPIACLNESTGSASAGDTIRFTSCSENADAYLWKVNNYFLNPYNSALLGNHFVVAGGGSCDNWIELSFYSAGTYSIDLTIPILTKGNCGESEMSYSKFDETSVSITITP